MRHERVTFPAGPLALEGLLELPEAGSPAAAVVVCHPHPQMGGDMYNQVVEIVCAALAANGIAALRFNFRGTGRSEGEHAGGEGEREDAWAALDYLRSRSEVDRSRLGLAGYSFGAAVALNCAAAAGIRALAAVSAPPRLLDFSAQSGFEFPVLVIAGDRDPYVPVDRLSALETALGPRTTVTIVPGVDHFWGGGEAALSAAVGSFFAAQLASGLGDTSAR